MENEWLHWRLAALRENAWRREERIRRRTEWVEARRRELWIRLDRQPQPSAPLPFEEYAAPGAQAAEPIRQVQVRGDERRCEARPPSVAPRPAEVLLAQYRDILLQASALIEAESATDERPADTRQLATSEPNR